MREFAFDPVFDPDVDWLVDLFMRTDELRARSLAAPADSWFWRLEQVSGPTEALRAVGEIRDGADAVGFAVEPGSIGTHNDCIERGYARCVFYIPRSRRRSSLSVTVPPVTSDTRRTLADGRKTPDGRELTKHITVPSPDFGGG